MRKIAPRWQFVIILAVLLFLWGASALWHSCNREELYQHVDAPALYPIAVELDSTSTQMAIDIDSAQMPKKRNQKPSFESEKMGKHHTPVARDFLEEDIDYMHYHR